MGPTTKQGHYKDDQDYCQVCDASCEGNCSGAGPAACEQCRNGYQLVDGVCTDVNECESGEAKCQDASICINKPGSFECVVCHEGCNKEAGCTGALASDCNECAAGYERDATTRRCNDQNECKTFACSPAETCQNTPGSFTCTCAASQAVAAAQADQPCALAPEVAGLDLAATAPDSLQTEDGETDSVVDVGASDRSRFKVTWVAFAKTQTTAPSAVRVAGESVCCGDKFAMHAFNVSTTGFSLLVARTDAQTGWSQHLRARWAARLDAAPKDEL